MFFIRFRAGIIIIIITMLSSGTEYAYKKYYLYNKNTGRIKLVETLGFHFVSDHKNAARIEKCLSKCIHLFNKK